MLSGNMRKKLFLFFILVIAILSCLAFKFFVLVLTVALLAVALLSNELMKKYIRKENATTIDFMSDSRRNFDALVIGHPLRPENKRRIKGDMVLYFTRKHRTLFASYLYLIHQYSYLREDGKGTIYIVSPPTDRQTYASLIDVYSFHPVVKKRLNVANSLRFPILFYLRKFREKQFFVDGKDIPIRERIEIFCKERNLKLEFINQ